MDGGGDSPVMTDSERRAYRYGHQASPRPWGVRKPWTVVQRLARRLRRGRQGLVRVRAAPTTHPGSFRCKHHRHAPNPAQAAEAPAAGADGKRHEQEDQGTAPAADQADK